MKIIEAMKQIKDLEVKAEDLRGKVAKYCTDLDHETPVYGTEQQQREQLESWIQAHSDILKEILHLRVAIQRTNLATPVEIQINGHVTKKSLAEWIHRRRDLAKSEQEMWAGLGRKEQGMREGILQTSTGEQQVVKIRRYYDPATRDTNLEVYRSEPNKIDATLEVVNAVTELVEK
jgi:hypothetical protein